MINIVIADDHPLVRQGIRSLFEKASDIQIVGEAADGQEAVEMVQRLLPDVVVMDVVMPRLNGTQALEKIRALGLPTQVVILSMYSDETLIYQVLRRGARGYVLKNSVSEELLMAVRAAARNEIFLTPAVSGVILPDLLVNRQVPKEQAAFEALSPREREVLQLIAEGNTNSKIAEKLFISEKTVEKHRASLMSKLDVHEIVGLFRIAVKHHLISMDR